MLAAARWDFEGRFPPHKIPTNAKERLSTGSLGDPFSV